MSEGDCRHCRKWGRCPGKEWYSFADIRFCVQQVFWLLKWAWVLRQGRWPAPETVVESGVRGKMSAGAPFAKAILIIAELDQRLARTGLRGELLVEQCINREKMDYLSDNAKDALYYVSGWSRNPRSFAQWLADRKYWRKPDKNIVKTGA